MLTAIIPIHSKQTLALIKQASNADILEFRLDYLSQIDLNLIQQLRQASHKPVIFTLRKPEQGGLYKGDETTRMQLITKLIALEPEYVDIEHDVPLAFCQQLKTLSPKTQLICSYHNYIDTPVDLASLLKRMINPVYSVYKIVTSAHSILDTLRVLQFVKQYSDQHTLVAHAMGELGETSRILGRVFGNCFTYASINQEADIAPGLLSVDELLNVYHYPHLNANTQIYGLIGDPIVQSIGHHYHNLEFIKNQQNAVYVKFKVGSEELTEFFQAIKDLPIQGLSVTMPHKNAVLKYAQQLTPEVQAIGAANTLMKRENSFVAANTDGDAVVQVIENSTSIKNKKITILGAGGAASSIIYSLIKAGALVSVYNRTPEKLTELAKKHSINIIAEDDLPHMEYDIVINTIPAKYYQNNINLIKNKIVLDANYQATPTDLIQDALKHDCICIDGYAMFYKQAELQRQLWFANNE